MGKKKGEVSNVKLAGNIEARVEVQPTPGEESPAVDPDMIQGYNGSAKTHEAHALEHN